jgi:hypothetical protein
MPYCLPGAAGRVGPPGPRPGDVGRGGAERRRLDQIWLNSATSPFTPFTPFTRSTLNFGIPRKGRKVWTVGQLQTFLQRSRQDRFFALWVLEATSGMRRCELAGEAES